MILDTNGLSAMADGDSGLEDLLRMADQVAIPVIVLGEYKYGIRQSRSRVRYEEWLQEVIAHCQVLAVNEETAELYAEIRDELKRKGRPIPGNDLWIAALARQHAFPIVSRDQHFDVVPRLRRIGW